MNKLIEYGTFDLRKKQDETDSPNEDHQNHGQTVWITQGGYFLGSNLPGISNFRVRKAAINIILSLFLLTLATFNNKNNPQIFLKIQALVCLIGSLLDHFDASVLIKHRGYSRKIHLLISLHDLFWAVQFLTITSKTQKSPIFFLNKILSFLIMAIFLGLIVNKYTLQLGIDARGGAIYYYTAYPVYWYIQRSLIFLNIFGLLGSEVYSFALVCVPLVAFFLFSCIGFFILFIVMILESNAINFFDDVYNDDEERGHFIRTVKDCILYFTISTSSFCSFYFTCFIRGFFEKNAKTGMIRFCALVQFLGWSGALINLLHKRFI